MNDVILDLLFMFFVFVLFESFKEGDLRSSEVMNLHCIFYCVDEIRALPITSDWKKNNAHKMNRGSRNHAYEESDAFIKD
eukprot:scaffold4420_cov187-Amphora_coffeaeformis.AAC.13